jgi:hypothetical protein
MSIKYFTGCNNITGGGKNQSSDTALVSLGIADTEPADNADGIDAKPHNVSKYGRILKKIYSKTTDTYGKSTLFSATCMKGCKPANSNTRASRIRGSAKYNLGRLVKYRKTLKKLFTDIGFTAQASSVGERNMYNGKNNGCVADVKHSKANENDYPMYPMDGAK